MARAHRQTNSRSRGGPDGIAKLAAAPRKNRITSTVRAVEAAGLRRRGAVIDLLGF
jgi:Tfp pilus assembly PilM family ATPase